MSEERRETTRHQVPTVLLQVESADKLRHRYLKDLSEGGMFIQTKRLVPEGEEVDVHLLPPHSEEPLVLRGLVVRAIKPDGDEPGGMGIQFLPTDTQTQDVLRDLLTRYGDPPLPAAEGGEQPASSDDSVTDLEALRGRLRSADGQIVALHEEIEKLEEDDAFQRQLVESVLAENKKLIAKQEELAGNVEQLAGDNAKLKEIVGQLSHEGEETKREFWELSADLAQVVAREEKRTKDATDLSDQATEALAAQSERTDDLAGRAERAEAEAKSARATLETFRDHHDALQTTNDKLTARLRRLRDSERHLRRMLALVAGESAQGDGEPISPEALKELQTRTGYEFNYDSGDVIDEELFAVAGKTRIPGAGDEAPSDDDASSTDVAVDAAFDVSIDEEEATAPKDDATATDIEVDTAFDVSTDGEQEPAQESALAGDIDVDVDLESDSDSDSEQTPANQPSEKAAVSDFVQQLRDGRELKLTSEFRAVQIVDRDEVVFSCVIERASSMETIREMTKKRFDEARIAELLDAFYIRGQIELDE